MRPACQSSCATLADRRIALAGFTPLLSGAETVR
jgi:hypothetical protein